MPLDANNNIPHNSFLQNIYFKCNWTDKVAHHSLESSPRFDINILEAPFHSTFVAYKYLGHFKTFVIFLQHEDMHW